MVAVDDEVNDVIKPIKPIKPTKIYNDAKDEHVKAHVFYFAGEPLFNGNMMLFIDPECTIEATTDMVDITSYDNIKILYMDSGEVLTPISISTHGELRQYINITVAIVFEDIDEDIFNPTLRPMFFEIGPNLEADDNGVAAT